MPGATPVALDNPRAATLDAQVATKKLPEADIGNEQETVVSGLDDGA
jgi:hypothetical protein